MLKNTQGNFFLSSMWAAEGRTDFCHVAWEWVNYDIFDQESVQFYLCFGEKVWDKNVSLPLKENAYLESMLKYFSFPDFKSIVAADGEVCPFGSLNPFPCSCLVGESIGCRMQGGLGVIHHGFSVLSVVGFGFVLFFYFKIFCWNLKCIITLLLFPLQLHIFPSSLDVWGPLVSLLLGQQVGVAESGQCCLVFPEAVFQHVITGVVCH